jgi:FkbM family methyltransferase
MDSELINAYINKQKEAVESLMHENIALKTETQRLSFWIEKIKNNMPEFKPKQILFNNQTKEIIWDGRDIGCFDILEHEWKELKTFILKMQKNYRVVVQAGGNCGLYPLYLSEMFERVFTFEPDPVNFYCLSHNCKNSKIIKYNTALGNTCGFLNISNEDPTNNGMVKVTKEGTTVYGMTVDSLNLDVVDLLFLDVEGFEYNVFLGAKNTIKRTRPTIIFEITSNKEEISDFLEKLDYQLVVTMNGNTQTLIYTPK